MDTSEHKAILHTNFQFPGQSAVYHGKVRDVYTIGDKLVMIATDRISAFDHILPRPIPFKGQVLNQVAAHFLEATRDIAPNWLISTPDPNAAIGYACKPFRIEMVIRGYLAGHAWRVYQSGERRICGVLMPDGMQENDRFPEPLITPATKADEGHDEDIAKEEIVERGFVSAEDYAILEDYTRRLFARGSAMAEERGLLLVDTKYEFGKKDGQIYVIDEIHTPDSSRYFYAEGYADRQAKGERQEQLSKEFVREWLMAHGFMGLENQMMPVMPESFVEEISNRYIELYERITGKPFVKVETAGIEARIYEHVVAAL